MYNFKWSHRTKDVFNKAVGKSKMVKKKKESNVKKEWHTRGLYPFGEKKTAL